MKTIYFDGVLSCGSYIIGASIIVSDAADKTEIVKSMREAGYVYYFDAESQKLVSTVGIEDKVAQSKELRYQIVYGKYDAPLITWVNKLEKAIDMATRFRAEGYYVDVLEHNGERVRLTEL